MNSVMMKKIPGVPNIHMGAVDVRNVAQAHLQAIKVPEAAGKRFLLVEGSYWFREIGEIMNKNYKDQGYSVAYKEMPKFAIWMASWFDKSADAALQYWGCEQYFDNTLSKEVLGIQYNDFEKTLCDMAEAMIETGYIPDKRKK